MKFGLEEWMMVRGDCGLLILIYFVSDCPIGWEVKPEFGKCYLSLTDEFRSWSNANDMCKALDPDTVATLTSVQSQAENDYVFSLINDFVMSSWIGGSDEDEEDVWR